MTGERWGRFISTKPPEQQQHSRLSLQGHVHAHTETHTHSLSFFVWEQAHSGLGRMHLIRERKQETPTEREKLKADLHTAKNCPKNLLKTWKIVKIFRNRFSRKHLEKLGWTLDAPGKKWGQSKSFLKCAAAAQTGLPTIPVQTNEIPRQSTLLRSSAAPCRRMFVTVDYLSCSWWLILWIKNSTFCVLH